MREWGYWGGLFKVGWWHWRMDGGSSWLTCMVDLPRFGYPHYRSMVHTAAESRVSYLGSDRSLFSFRPNGSLPTHTLLFLYTLTFRSSHIPDWQFICSAHLLPRDFGRLLFHPLRIDFFIIRFNGCSILRHIWVN